MVVYRYITTKPREFAADETRTNMLYGSILSRLKTCEGVTFKAILNSAVSFWTINLTTKWMLTGLWKLLVEVGAAPLVH
jgi:hypothetical protein